MQRRIIIREEQADLKVDSYLGVAVNAFFSKPTFDQSTVYIGPTPTFSR